MAIGEPALGDLTARARIRDAAMQLFVERGIEGTTIRAIAREAGVSGGLVRHHLGSKDDVRAACDAHVLAQMMRYKEQAVVKGQIATTSFVSSVQPKLLVMLRYFARSVFDGSPAADEKFSAMIDLAERWLADQHPGETADPTAYGALLVAMELGTLVMSRQLSLALGADVFSPEDHLRLARPKLDFYSRPLLSPELAASGRRALGRLQRRSPAPTRHAKNGGRR